ncbi:MAG: CheR family methyltransferase [Myxococcota bacterium]
MLAPDATPELGEREFVRLCTLFERHTGIRPRPDRKHLVASRLLRRLRARRTSSYAEYVELLGHPDERGELMRAIDALTTHETSFFREPSHFDFLDAHFATLRRRELRLWSAACSTGEEVWTLAMVAASRLGLAGFTIDGTDVAPGVIETAKQGLYPLSRASSIPGPLLKRWCLKGEGPWEGSFLVARELRARARFHVANLCLPQAQLGSFDVILLRNVLFYFSPEQQQKVLRNVVARLVPGGLLLVGHCERAQDVHPRLALVEPSVYRLEPP